MIPFAATVGLSAFLLFLVQPVIAKQILPWFGGSAAVWTTCLVFFQGALLAGYFYADRLVRYLQPRQQAWVHALLLLASLIALPITASASFRPTDADNPIGRILLLLLATIGLPYLMLASTGPLIQAWFARSFEGTPQAVNVWRLYALSNAASMLALLAYPLVIEPATSAHTQSISWSVGYGLFVLLAIATAVAAATAAGDQNPRKRVAESEDLTPAEPAPLPTRAEQNVWLVLSALASTLLLSITAHVTQNVASVPFMWIVPLAIYLLSFILTFDGRSWYWPRVYPVLACVMAVLMMLGLIYRPNPDLQPEDGVTAWLVKGLLPLDLAAPLYAYGLFVLCMFCHGELVRRKPQAAHLTRFYLMVALGGALGGLLVGVVAPLLFSWVWELPLALLGAALLALMLSPGRLKLLGFAAVIACLYFGAQYATAVRENVIEMTRNFYGTLRIKQTAADDLPNARWRLLHGVIAHGEQYRAPEKSRKPTSYYGEGSGVAQAIMGLRALRPGRPQRVGLVGLGVGTLAAYGREGDVYRFYELDPSVLELAQKRFTYLSESPAEVQTVLGDARLMLEQEKPQAFDVLAVDAFSSDSIPVHLITTEAMAVFTRHLAAGGVVAFHISNRYLNLQPVVQQLADVHGYRAWLVADEPPDDSHLYKSDWVLVTRNLELLEHLRQRGMGQMLEGSYRAPLWTDDHNNLLEVLR